MITPEILEKAVAGDVLRHGQLFEGLSPTEMEWTVESVKVTEYHKKQRLVARCTGTYFGVPIGDGVLYVNSKGVVRIAEPGNL